MKWFFQLILLLLCLIHVSFGELKPAEFVDPFIGTGGHGHTYPGAVRPFGMVQLSPDTRVDTWDGCSGYHYSDSSIIGFSHTHLSGTGCIDYGDVLVAPTTGKLLLTPGSVFAPEKGYRSRFSHDHEKASPGYYGVLLEDDSIEAELTATSRCGFHRYTFPKGDTANVIIDLKHGLGPDEVLESYLEIVDNKTIRGFRRSKGWAENQIVFFFAEFSREFDSFGVSEDEKKIKGKQKAEGKSVKGYVRYHEDLKKPLLLKVGISSVSLEGAEKNLKEEIPRWNFEEVKKQGESAWNEALAKIEVKGGDENRKTIFYTSLYHSLLNPNLYMDVDGRYRGMDSKIYKGKDFQYYTVFSFWDTYRGAHPLLTIIDEERAVDFVKTLLAKYGEHGSLPVWELAGNDTGTMIGYHGVSVIVDACMKGLEGFDMNEAFEAVRNSAKNDGPGFQSYLDLGYVPADRESQSVSKTLEYAYDDWCVSILADKLGKEKDYEWFTQRAKNYQYVFDGATGFARGRKKNGNWKQGFDPEELSHDYTEANAWQYSYYVPHDVKGLMCLLGGSRNLERKLDSLFTLEFDPRLADIPDITGLMGQYAHGNEPSHHLAFLYTYLGKPWKTREKIKEIMATMYTSGPDGLSGNEDCGQMSAWYVLNAMGFYPVCPGTNEYVFGVPLFEEIKINLGNGKEFLVKGRDLSSQNGFVKEIRLNGKTHDKSFITHEEIIRGGTLEFVFGRNPHREKNDFRPSLPYSLSVKDFVSPPYIRSGNLNFTDSSVMDWGCATNNADIYYAFDGEVPGKRSHSYDGPMITKNSRIAAVKAFAEGFDPSIVMNWSYVKMIPKNPIDADKVVNGARYSYYEGEFSSVFELRSSKPVKKGVVEGIGLSISDREDHYGLIFKGLIQAPVTGTYEFYLVSDDGSVLFVDGEEVVNNDGSHSAFENSGKIALREGLHSYELLYFEDYEGQALKWFFRGPGLEKTEVSDSILFYQKK